MLTRFEDEDASDRADSVDRDRCLGSPLILHLALPCFAWDSWYPTCFTLGTSLSCCLSATLYLSFCSLIADVVTVDFLMLMSCFSVFDRFLKESVFLGFHSAQTPVVNHRGGFDFGHLLIQILHPQACDA